MVSDDMIAKKVLNILSRAKNPGLPAIPPDIVLPSIAADRAAKTLDVIGRAAGTKSPLHTQRGAPPQEALDVIKQMNELPWPPPDYPLQDISPAELADAGNMVREITGHIRARTKQK